MSRGEAAAPDHSETVGNAAAEKPGRPVRRPGVTLLCCSYNRESALRATVPSKLCVAGVTKVLFVLDGSTDGSADYLESIAADDSRVEVVVRPHSGLQATRNAALALVETEWVLLIDDDDLCRSDFVQKLQSTAAAMSADIVGAPWLNATAKPIDQVAREGEQTRSDRYSLRSHPSQFTVSDVETPFLSSAILARTEIAQTFEYDRSYQGNSWREETDMFLRCFAEGTRIARATDTYIWSEKRYGGGHPRSRLRYEWWVLVNEARFLRRHSTTLKRIDPEWSVWPLELVRTVAPRIREAVGSKMRSAVSKGRRR